MSKSLVAPPELSPLKKEKDSPFETLSSLIQTREAKIAIIGLGYVGLPLLLTFQEAGFSVIGLDTDLKKLQAIQEGRSYLKHIDSSRLQKAQASGTLIATDAFRECSLADVVIICVPTPLNKALQPDLSYIEATSKAIAPHLKPAVLVSLESTTWPGTTEEIVQPILEEGGAKELGKDFFLCFSPEREDPGNERFTTKTIPKIVGGKTPACLKIATALYEAVIDQVVPVSSTKVAETAKLFENIFRSVNIALVNELKMIAEPMGIDVFEVIEACATKPFGFMPFWPGPGLGGHCIPIDPFYLTYKAKEYGQQTRFIELAGEINRSMPAYVVKKVTECLNTFKKSVNGSKILVLGLSYKPNVDDIRESPSLEILRLLEDLGAQTAYHDPHCPYIPSLRDHPELIGRQSKPLSSDFDCFVIATAHAEFCPEEILSFQVPCVDTRNLLKKHPLTFPA